MAQPLSGAGVGLQVPQALYPTNLTSAEYQPATNTFTLAGGEALPIPAGRWVVDLGKYGSLQYMDPVTNVWTLLRSGDNNDQTITIWSDGFNVRAANETGCPVAAVVTNGGNGAYVQSTTTVVPSVGNSTWQAVVGGAVGTTVSVTTPGSGYGIAPLVFFDAPSNAPGSPDVQATGIAVLTSGSVSSITVINQGAGYTVAPNVTILANPADPNIATLVNATATCTLTGAGSITAILCTNPGVAVASVPTLTIAGSGASAAATALVQYTITAASVTTAGAGYGTAAYLTTVGGFNAVASPAFVNPLIQQYDYVQRPANIALTASSSITGIGTIVDGGLFIGTPTGVVIGSGVVTTAAVVAVTLGSANTTIRMQQVA